MIEKFLSDLGTIGVGYVKTITKPSSHSEKRFYEYEFDRTFTVWLSAKKIPNVVSMVWQVDSSRVELISDDGSSRVLFIKSITRIAREVETDYKTSKGMER